MKRVISLVLCCFLVVAAAAGNAFAVNGESAELFPAGDLTESAYENKALCLGFRLNDGWVASERAAISAVQQMGLLPNTVIFLAQNQYLSGDISIEAEDYTEFVDFFSQYGMDSYIQFKSEAYESRGHTIERSTRVIAGTEYESLRHSYVNQKGNMAYGEEIYYMTGNFLITISAFSYEQDHLDEVFSKFYLIENPEDSENNTEPEVGDILVFGSYEQDNNIQNGKEPIEWIVLDRDGDKALVVSCKGLDFQPYDPSNSGSSWENSSLRAWLNGTFLNTAFSWEEQAKIQTITLNADGHKSPMFTYNVGNVTQDKVFLLTVTEAYKYFDTDEERKLLATPYEEAQGDISRNGYCDWWLRTLGDHFDRVACVYADGRVDEGGWLNYFGFAVRPAMWIDYRR